MKLQTIIVLFGLILLIIQATTQPHVYAQAVDPQLQSHLSKLEDFLVNQFNYTVGLVRESPDKTINRSYWLLSDNLVAMHVLAKDHPEIAARINQTMQKFGIFYAVYLTAVFSESTFLAATTASLYYMRRGRDGRAAVAAAIAMLVRITGVALIPALIVDHLVRRRGRPGRGLIAILSSLLAPLLFVAYAWRSTGDPLAYLHVERSASFNRLFAWPWDGARATFASFVGGPGGNSFVFGMEMLFGVAGLVAVIWLAWHWRTVAPALTVFAAVAWLMSTSLSTG